MSNVPRGWAAEDARRVADPARWPVLAQLPDASASSLPERFAKPTVLGSTEYRFDPPQAQPNETQAAGATRAAASQPHMLESHRRMGQRGIPRRQSSVLPHSNPFSNPRPQLLDSLAPAVRFLTMAALFTAIGVWVQMLGHHAPAKQPAELHTTETRPNIAPQKNADNHPAPAPTATGPIETQPKSGARVGRVEGDDFALNKNSSAGPVPTGGPAVSPPHYLISSGNQLPRVRVSDTYSCEAIGREASTATPNTNMPPATNESPSMARFPGFMMDIPTR